MSISRTKSFCTASTAALGKRLVDRLSEFNLQLCDRVTSLGSALGAGKRSNAKELQQRLNAFKKRSPRYRKLVAAGVCSKKLMRTGGVSALTFGQAATGVSNTNLLQQRRAVALATAPRAGLGGQNLDLALALADGNQPGRPDPAHGAHAQPIGMWSEAIWQNWPPTGMMKKLFVVKRVTLTNTTCL